MLAKFKLYAGMLLGILLLIAGAFLKGRSSGKDEVIEQNKEQEIVDKENVAKVRVESVKAVNNVQSKVIKDSDKAVDKELADEWTR